MTLPLPRNAAAIKALIESGAIKRDDTVVASFVGSTNFAEPHVFCDSGVRYDWEFLKWQRVAIVVKPGIDAEHAMWTVLQDTRSYPTFVDIEQQVVGSIVDAPGCGRKHGVKLWQRRRGSQAWCDIFT